MPRRKRKETEYDGDRDAGSDASEKEDDRVPSREDKNDADENYDEPPSDNETNQSSVKEEPVEISNLRKRKKKTYELTTEDDLLPTHARKTKKGGYAHTNSSKGKISKANAGNTPWNKGKNRSSADRAKIAAGVRGRNRAILLEKLKRLGLSEEEYEVKKKEIKYLRERLRRATRRSQKLKCSDAEFKLKTADTERKLKAALHATTEKVGSAMNHIPGQPPMVHILPKQPDSDCDPDREINTRVTKVAGEVFSRDVVWTPFLFGDEGEQYHQACLTGGPGGLVCCDACGESYTAYLSRTVKDMEVQRMYRNGKATKELLKFLKQGREALEGSYDAAKKKVPPLPPPSQPKPAQQPRNRRVSAGTRETFEPAEWNMTSAIDVAAAKNFVSV